jgi:hypothetical protein
MLLHANTVTQNRSASVRTRRIDRDDANGPSFFSIMAGKLIHQCAFTRSRRAGEAEYSRLSAVRKERLKQFGPAWCAVLDRADGTGQSAQVAGSQLLDHGVKRIQAPQCKAEFEETVTRE